MNIPVNIFRCVAAAMSKDSSRYILNGIEVTPKKDGVVLCATDAAILIAAYVEGYFGIEESFIIPAHLVNYITSNAKILELAYVENRVILETGKTKFSALKVDGNYPAWRKIMKPSVYLIEHIPNGLSQQVIDAIFRAQAALGLPRKDRGIHSVHCEGDKLKGAHYMQLEKNVVVCFMPTRKALDDAAKFVWPEWAE